MSPPIPNVWEALDKEGCENGLSGLLNIWKNRLRTSKPQNEAKPLLVLCVTFGKMVNLIPQDAPHPLYSSDYFELTDQFILDHLCEQKVDLDDPALQSEDGLKLETMSGKEIVFKKKAESDKTTLNNIEIETQKCLSDGTHVIILKDFLFNHFDDTKKAFKQISLDITNEFCPLSNT